MFKRIFVKDIDNWKYWLTIAIIIKVLFFIFNYTQKLPESDGNIIYAVAGDTWHYIAPIENFIKGGGYSPDFRMPGYGAVYLLFRLILAEGAALNALVLAQLFLASVSVYFLALSAYHIFESKALFYGTFYAYLFSTFTSIFDIFLVPESLMTSSLIFALFYFVKGINERKVTALFLSGALLTWCVFLKPVALPLFGLYVFILSFLWIKKHRFGYLKTLKAIALFLVCFLLIDGAWVIRNYKVYGKVIPLQKRLRYADFDDDKILVNIMDFLKSWGGDFTWWDPKAEINWFGYLENSKNIREQIGDIHLPAYIYTSKFNYSSLLKVKEYIGLSRDKNLPNSEQDKFRQLAAEELDKYTLSIRKEKPHIYYIYAPLRRLKKFLFQSGTYNLFKKTYRELNMAELAFKLSMSMLYLFVVIGGLIGMTALFLKNYTINLKFLLAAITLYLIVIFPFVFRLCENRYLILAYPFMLMCAVYSVKASIPAVYFELLVRRNGK